VGGGGDRCEYAAGVLKYNTLLFWNVAEHTYISSWDLVPGFVEKRLHAAITPVRDNSTIRIL